MRYKETLDFYEGQKWAYQQISLSFLGIQTVVEEIKERLDEVAQDDGFNVGIKTRIVDGGALEVDLVDRDKDHLWRIGEYLRQEVESGRLKTVPNRIGGTEGASVV